MSVVNKMLQDLEARKPQDQELNADYQPPEKRHSKYLLVSLLILALAAIVFALTDLNWILNKSTALSHSVSPVASTTTESTQTAQNAPQQVPDVASAQSATGPAVEFVAIQPTAPLIQPIVIQPQAIEPSQVQPLSVNQPMPVQQQLVTEPVVNSQPTEQQPSFSMNDSKREHKSVSLKQQIAESLANNQNDQAQSLLSELLVEEPDNLKARKKLASLYFSEGKYALTRQLLVRGIDLHPNQADLRLMLARLYAVQKSPEQALKILKEFEPNHYNQAEYLAYRAGLGQKLDQLELAKADYLTLTQIQPTNAKWLLGLAITHDKLGDIAAAKQTYSKALAQEQLDDSVQQFIQQRISVLSEAQ